MASSKTRKPAKVAKASVAAPVHFDALDAYHNVAKAYMVKVGNEIIWEGASEQRLPPASLTKMMTALLVLESYRPNDVVEVSREAAAETGSRLGLRAGDRLLLSDVLAATLIRSANDACHALADWHSGSEAVFVARMNQRAEQLGLRNTHFMNACGFDNPEHYSTARDLAVIAETAMNNPTFARIVTKERMSFRSVDGRRTFRVKTTNHLIGALDGIQGVKTGFTNGAGPCLVAMADRNGERVTLVMLNARNRWWNATAMIDSAFVEGPRLVAKKHEKQSQQAASAATPAASAPDTSSAALARGA
ncbi:MAG: D-alanyl-D-alanine carboxypeptidase family protein [Spongiibacteraceae bacterium]